MSTKTPIEGPTFKGYKVDPSELILIGLDTEDGPDHPLYDDRVKEPPDPVLVQRILKRGFRSVIYVVKDGDRILVQTGRRRVKAAREANRILREQGSDLLIRVLCTTDRGTDAENFSAMIEENEIRKDYTPIQRARNMQRADRCGLSKEEIADMFGGISVQTVDNHLSLLDLHQSVQEAVEEGRISADAVRPLVGLPKAEQPGALEEILLSGVRPSNAVTVAKVREKKGLAPKVRPGLRLIKHLVHGDGINLPVPLSPDFHRALSWVLGEVQIPELSKIPEASE